MLSNDQGVQLSSAVVDSSFLAAASFSPGEVSLRLSRLDLANVAVFVRVTVDWRVGRMPDLCAKNR